MDAQATLRQAPGKNHNSGQYVEEVHPAPSTQVQKAEKTNESYFLASWNAAIDFLEYTPIQHFKENHSGTRIKGLYNKQVIYKRQFNIPIQNHIK